jgi:hypothetical protein
MTLAVELIYFDGCPNAEPTRTNLREALATLGLAADWQEWEQGDPQVPAHVKQHGSPTILVNGRDVTGVDAGVGGAACRADGVPSADAIRAALEAAV